MRAIHGDGLQEETSQKIFAIFYFKMTFTDHGEPFPLIFLFFSFNMFTNDMNGGIVSLRPLAAGLLTGRQIQWRKLRLAREVALTRG